jgi:uncharacterized protein
MALTMAEFGSLASGHGSAAALGKLVAGQLAKRRLLLWGVVRAARAAGLPVEEPLALLLRVHDLSPATLDEVIAHPQVDAWAASFTPADLGYLHALAAAAAVRAGLPFTLDVPPARGAVTLPGMGPLATGDAPARLGFDGGDLRLDGRPAHPRRLVLDLADAGGPAVAIEDADQYRDLYRMPVAGALADPGRFAALWRDAWRLLAADHPAHARATKALLRSFVPLAPPGDGAEHSAASARATGSIALAPPATASAMALLVLHETQHLKLGALLDLIDLDTGDGQARHHAPWRGDPRPVRGLLQGTYAHLGVTEFWRRRDGRQFAYWRAQTSRAAATLAGSGELTEAGARFVAGIRDTLDGWAADPVPAADQRIADVCVRVGDLVWRLGHRETAAGARAALLDSWRSGGTPPAGVVGDPRVRRTAEARILAALRGDHPDLPDADRALLAGDDRTAAAGYARRIVAGLGTDDDWAGLAVTSGASRPEPARDLFHDLLLDDPAGDDPPADPREIVRWCAAG